MTSHTKLKRPVVIAAFANDHVDHARFLRNLSREAQRMQTAFEPAQAMCKLIVLPGATLDQILETFQKYRDRVAIFHYGGHANGFQLLLEAAAGGVQRIGAAGLASFLGQQNGLQLVFLNGCSTERQTDDLLKAGVGCVIATTQAIDDGVATDFSGRFYGGIVTGAPIRVAYAEAVGAAQAAADGSIHRLLVPLDGPGDGGHPEPVAVDRWPWFLRVRSGADRVAHWNLPDAMGDPLFGLPGPPTSDLPDSPFRHLNRFDARHAEVFFGRSSEIRDLYLRIMDNESPPVIQLYGPSGVGKSSLLDAGLLPRLGTKVDVRYIRRDATLGLCGTLCHAIATSQQLSLAESWRAHEKATGRPLVVVLDQVEEAFTRPVAGNVREVDELATTIRATFSRAEDRPAGKLVLSYRKEWCAEIDEALAAALVPRSHVFLDRLNRNGVIDAIVGPTRDPRLAARYNLTVEEGLPELIADDLLADPDTPVAPTLQILLARMWNDARARDASQARFNAELYAALHRDGVLLDDFVRQQLHALGERLPGPSGSGLVIDLLHSHTTSLGTSSECSLASLKTMYSSQSRDGSLAATLRACEELYLLTSDRESANADSTSYRLLHDTLAPLIRTRYEHSDLPGQRARRILDNRVVDWKGNRAGESLDQADLKAVEAGASGTSDWSPDEQRLVEASRKRRAVAKTWRRGLQSAAIVAIAAIVCTSALAWVQRGYAKAAAASARRELALSQSRQGQMARDIDGDDLRAVHHFASAVAASDDPIAAEAMRFATGQSLAGAKLVDVLEHPGSVHEAWRLSSGDIITWANVENAQREPVTHINADHAILRWNEQGPKVLFKTEKKIHAMLLTEDESTCIVMVAPTELFGVSVADGKVVPAPPAITLEMVAERNVRAMRHDKPWDEADVRLPLRPEPPVYGYSFSHDKRRVLVWTAAAYLPTDMFIDYPDNVAGYAQVWDVSCALPLTPRLRLTRPLRGARFAGGDSRVLVWGEDGRVAVWDLADAVAAMNALPVDSPPIPRTSPPNPLPLPGRGNGMVAWDEKGWRVSGASPVEVSCLGLMGVALSKNGHSLLGWGGSDGFNGAAAGGFVCVWDTNTGALRIPLLRHAKLVTNAEWDSREQRILAATSNSVSSTPDAISIHIWDMNTATELIAPIPRGVSQGQEAHWLGSDDKIAIRNFTGDTDLVTTTIDLSKTPRIQSADARMEVVRRTGTFIDLSGEPRFLTRKQWKSLQAAPANLDYDTWRRTLPSD